MSSTKAMFFLFKYASSNIVASFQLQRPLSQLDANISQLRHDIFEEIGVANSSVIIMSLEPLPASNWTNVVFGIWPFPKSSNISSAGLSILRSTFVTLVTEPSTLRLTWSLFGNPFFFQVLEFPGGITIIPPQGGFPLQEPRMLFNFTLNFSVYQVYGKISELKNQLSSGLHLSNFESLYIFQRRNSDRCGGGKERARRQAANNVVALAILTLLS
ncbi:unnamed protein product [Spirodela intermedia]|uniref:DUF7036 domain-containing protein n=1 Tax=Spirodela intermedia TaxID=51605 RepID=A0A7I8I8Z5_SPIIN|nr:unnamed protein product [Spirodela intermedia]CAA6653998.1 unnamed protein product [Spirodela intermedia]